MWVNTESTDWDVGGFFDITGSDVSVLEATGFAVENPGGTRWQSTSPGALGDLVDEENEFLVTSGTRIAPMTTVLFATLSADATAPGTPNVEISTGDGLVVAGSAALSPTYLPIEVTVASDTMSPVPLPTSGLVFLSALGWVALWRRRHA